jgi:2-keto-4-pentenoate hydratase/2-oxohepta-3-ene-1,7-dioic acid hydratase in catechol pathway
VRLATVKGRATVLVGEDAFDVERASQGRFPARPAALFESWADFAEWAVNVGLAEDGRHREPVELALLDAPSPLPRQIYGIGLNYRDHAAEAGVTPPESPAVFTKFLTSIDGPYRDLVLPSSNVDWEGELVAIIGRRAHNVSVDDAWGYVAGLSIGQDYSERIVQAAGPVPQFSMGKSFPGFGPIGPWLVTPDEFADPDDLAIECTINGETVQKSRTSNLIFSVPELVSRLSTVTPLLPGDVIFTGTPAGVGWARKPQRYLRPGDVVVTRIEGIGAIKQGCIAR